MDNTSTYSDRSRNAILYSLAACILMVVTMIAIGGATRLTGSGLSMPRWQPLLGILPPLNRMQWQEVFQLYQQTPEYNIVHQGMTLPEFKSIFWLEYIHRAWGRLMGIALLAVTFFAYRSTWRATLMPRIGLVWVLGLCQGFLGWYMVKSGLIDQPWVSPYRLAAHLLMALVILSVLVWIASSYMEERSNTIVPKNNLTILLVLILATVTLGAFTAGLKAGLVYNTFPKMGDQWIPDEVFHLQPLWTNLTENPVGVQFVHRIMASITLLWAGILTVRFPSKYTYFLILMVAIQVILGITTLLAQVPVDLGVAHQVWAVCVFLYVLWLRLAKQLIQQTRQSHCL